MTSRVDAVSSASVRTEAAVLVSGVRKSFGGRVALADVDLAVPTAGVHGLLGPNGAGKTTLLRMLLGLVAPDRGRVAVLGRTPFAARGALPGVAGFVEAPRFYPYLSAAKNLDLLGALDGGRSARRVDDLLEQVGLGGRAREKVRGFSTGMRQRLGLAAVLLRDPDLLVLDEPTTGLDPAGVAELHHVIGEVAGSGRTVLLSSHDMAEVEDLCDAVTILRDGQVVHSGSIRALRAEADAATYALATADDDLAAARLQAHELVSRSADGLVVRAEQERLDALVLELARDGVAVRALARRDTALNQLFLRLTGEPEPAVEQRVSPPVLTGIEVVETTRSPSPSRTSAATVALWELEKLIAQTRVRLAFLVCLLGPFVFSAGLRATSSLPADTLFGRWVHDSGLAAPLVVLGFATSWGFPILTCVVAGDVFAGEDTGGTWPMLLTRSTGRGSIVAGKVLAVAVYVVAVLGVLALASLAAGLLAEGGRPLVGLTGNVVQPGHGAVLVLASWLSVLPVCLAIACVGMLLSVLTRNGVAAIVGVVVLGLAMQLGTLVDGIGPVRPLLWGTQLTAWHALFTEPATSGPVLTAALVAAAYVVVSLALVWAALRRRDVT